MAADRMAVAAALMLALGIHFAKAGSNQVTKATTACELASGVFSMKNAQESATSQCNGDLSCLEAFFFARGGYNSHQQGKAVFEGNFNYVQCKGLINNPQRLVRCMEILCHYERVVSPGTSSCDFQKTFADGKMRAIADAWGKCGTPKTSYGTNEEDLAKVRYLIRTFRPTNQSTNEPIRTRLHLVMF